MLNSSFIIDLFSELNVEASNADKVLGKSTKAFEITSSILDTNIIFNSSLRFNLIARLSGISKIYQYPLFQKTDQHIIDTPKKFFIDKINLKVFLIWILLILNLYHLCGVYLLLNVSLQSQPRTSGIAKLLLRGLGSFLILHFL